jgi:DNA-binding IclR family transcriptional regulator
MLLVGLILRDGLARPLPEIAAEVGIPISTAHRIAALLVRRKLLVRAKPGRYVAAYALTTCGGRDAANRSLSLTARPLLKSLAARTGATVHLGSGPIKLVAEIVVG